MVCSALQRERGHAPACRFRTAAFLRRPPPERSRCDIRRRDRRRSVSAAICCCPKYATLAHPIPSAGEPRPQHHRLWLRVLPGEVVESACDDRDLSDCNDSSHKLVVVQWCKCDFSVRAMIARFNFLAMAPCLIRSQLGRCEPRSSLGFVSLSANGPPFLCKWSRRKRACRPLSSAHCCSPRVPFPQAEIVENSVPILFTPRRIRRE